MGLLPGGSRHRRFRGDCKGALPQGRSRPPRAAPEAVGEERSAEVQTHYPRVFPTRPDRRGALPRSHTKWDTSNDNDDG